MNEKISIQDIAEALALSRNISQQEAMDFVKEVFALIAETLEKEHYVKIKGLGTFKLIEVDTRESIHIQTKERIRINSHYKITFVPDAILRDLVNKPFSHFETVVLNEESLFDDIPVVEEENEGDLLLSASDNFLPESAVTPPTPIKENNISESEMKETKRNRFYFIGIVTGIILLFSFTLLYIYRPQALVDVLAVPQPVSPLPVSEDTILIRNQVAKIDSTATTVVPEIKKDTFENSLPIVKKRLVKQPVISDSVTYLITGTKTTYVLQEGETLTMVSKRFYGTKALWPYIYEYNRKIIKNPNRVPYGTRLKIPELKEK